MESGDNRHALATKLMVHVFIVRPEFSEVFVASNFEQKLILMVFADMREPEFEYMHPPPYHPPQVHYPGKQPFDR